MSTQVDTLRMGPDRVLVRSLKPRERYSETGLIVSTAVGEERPCHGMVHAAGENTGLKKGQEVLFAKFTGAKIIEEPGPDEPIFSVHEKGDILGVIRRLGDEDD